MQRICTVTRGTALLTGVPLPASRTRAWFNTHGWTRHRDWAEVPGIGALRLPMTGLRTNASAHDGRGALWLAQKQNAAVGWRRG